MRKGAVSVSVFTENFNKKLKNVNNMEMTAAICADEDVPAIAYEETIETSMDIGMRHFTLMEYFKLMILVADHNDNYANYSNQTNEYLTNVTKLASAMFPDTLAQRELEMLANLFTSTSSIGPDKLRKLCLVGAAAAETLSTNPTKRKAEPSQDHAAAPVQKLPKLELIPVEQEKLPIKKRRTRSAGSRAA